VRPPPQPTTHTKTQGKKKERTRQQQHARHHGQKLLILYTIRQILIRMSVRLSWYVSSFRSAAQPPSISRIHLSLSLGPSSFCESSMEKMTLGSAQKERFRVDVLTCETRTNGEKGNVQ
jgi:hypothetical protein